CVNACNGAASVKFALKPSADTVNVPGRIRFNPMFVGNTSTLELVTATCLLNRTRITALVGTPVLPLAGSINVTTGCVKSAPAAVVNVVVTGTLITFPLTSATPVIVTV